MIPSVNPKPPKKVLLVGATGFSGQGVLTVLSDNPLFELTAHVRPDSPNKEALENICTEKHISILCVHFSESASKITELEPDIILSFIGTTSKKMRTLGQSYMDIDFEINETLIAIAESLPKPPLYIYMSSMGIEWAGWSPYLEARLAVEQRLARSILPHIILRPGLLHGPSRTESRPLEHLSAILTSRFCEGLMWIGLKELSYKWKPLTAEDIGIIVQHLLMAHQKNDDINRERIIDIVGMHQVIQTASHSI